MVMLQMWMQITICQAFSWRITPKVSHVSIIFCTEHRKLLHKVLTLTGWRQSRSQFWKLWKKCARLQWQSPVPVKNRAKQIIIFKGSLKKNLIYQCRNDFNQELEKNISKLTKYQNVRYCWNVWPCLNKIRSQLGYIHQNMWPMSHHFSLCPQVLHLWFLRLVLKIFNQV